jgi:hypothetical protein
MRHRILLVIPVLVSLALAAPVAADSDSCSFAGTWYGGSAGAKYLMTIVPKGGNSYSVTAEGAYTLAALGVVVNTSYSGEMVKVGPKRYEARLITLLTYQTTPPPTAGGALEIDAARAFMELTGCNEMTSTIDYFVGYWGWGKEPFVDEPDIDLLVELNGGEPLIETYRRISTAPM